ncbi:ATP-binding protein [Tenacibaculum singaporense]|uniref:histidine kinase n=1 Tax=Tenacibaculum singaporense TaxID=2358479 RepID=A0A3S8RAM8_9FLAO|nr:PAS domain-containing sensor histidine kinase [Tenacibaculum singaporense]AZJ36817.1 PAS domain S-box protein [Tenacibaculum singaporense]
MEHYLKKELYDLIKTDDSIFSFIQEGSLDGLWYWDLENPENEWMNEKFWTELGYNPNEMPHKSDAWQNIINKDDLNTALENFNKHCEDSNHPYDQVVRYKHKDGSTVYIRCRGLVIRNSLGTPIRMLGAHNNITKIMTTTTKLKEANKMLAEKNKELEQFAYIASHDLQEPVNTIQSFADLLLQDYGNDIEKEASIYLNYISVSAKRMKSLINSLLDYSKLGENKNLSNINCDELLKNVLIDLDKKIKNSKAIIKIGSLPKLKGYETELGLLFLNLIGNAIKFQKQNIRPQIFIDAKKENGWTFSITDNGIGIDEPYKEKIFSMFQRLNNRSEYEGTGIGLAHCKKIASMHNGNIWVQSELGVGSTFYFNIKV